MPFENPTHPHLTRRGHALVEITSACFVGSDGTEEYNFMLKPLQYGRISDQLDWLEAEAILALLPGFRDGRLSHLSGGLRSSDDEGEQC